MTECTVYPPHLASNPWFYTTQIIATPIVFGAGVLGNMVCMLVFNHKSLRKAHPAYAYLNGLSVVDFIGLCLLIPKYIQECEALPPQQTHSKVMTHIVNGSPGLAQMCTHSSTWYILMVAIVFIGRIRTKHYKPSWTKISISRIMAFVIFAAAGLLNFPTFFEYSVKLIKGHCMEGIELWGLIPTSLAESILYTSLYRWIITGIVFLIPYNTIVIVAISLPTCLGIKNFCRKSILKNTYHDEERALQLGKSIFILILVFIILETPHNIGSLFVTLNGPNVKLTAGFREFTLVAELLRRVRLVVPFVIYALYDGEFRKSIHRVLCCSGDEFYEPCACCCPSMLEREEQQNDWAKQNGVFKENKRLSKRDKMRKGSDYSRWV